MNRVKKPISKDIPKVFTGNVVLGKQYLTINLPLEMAEYIGVSAKDKEICWSGINGGIQITKEPTMLGIPALTDTDEFVNQG